MYDIKITGTRKSDQSGCEEIHRLRPTENKNITRSDLIAFIYKTYARRDIDVISVSVVEYVPKIMNVSIQDDGTLLINGKEADTDVFNEVSSVVTLDSSPQPSVTMETAPKPKEIQPVVSKLERQPMPDPKDAAGSLLQYDEIAWFPNSAESASGIQRVITWKQPKVLAFSALPIRGDRSIYPFTEGQRLIIDRMVRDIQGNDFYIVKKNDQEVTLPIMYFVEPSSVAPTTAVRSQRDDVIELEFEREGQSAPVSPTVINDDIVPLDIQDGPSTGGLHEDKFVIRPRV